MEDVTLSAYIAFATFDVEQNGYIITLGKNLGPEGVVILKEINPPDSEQVMVNMEELSPEKQVTLLKRLARKYDEMLTAPKDEMASEEVIDGETKNDTFFLSSIWTR